MQDQIQQIVGQVLHYSTSPQQLYNQLSSLSPGWWFLVGYITLLFTMGKRSTLNFLNSVYNGRDDFKMIADRWTSKNTREYMEVNKLDACGIVLLYLSSPIISVVRILYAIMATVATVPIFLMKKLVFHD